MNRISDRLAVLFTLVLLAGGIAIAAAMFARVVVWIAP